MTTRSSYDGNPVSTGLEVGDVFANMETVFIANRKALFDIAKKEQDFNAAVYRNFEAYRKANTVAAYNALQEANKLSATEINRAYNEGVKSADKAIEHYQKEGYEAKKQDGFNTVLFSSLLTIGAAIGGIVGYATQAADMQLMQILSMVNPRADNIDEEIDRAQLLYLQKGIPGAYDSNGTEKEISGQGEFVVRQTAHETMLSAEGERANEYGTGLIQISSHPSSCPLCLPWQGRILVNDLFAGATPDGKHELASVAKAAGLWHYNCYDKETEVLTNEGWKLFSDLNQNEFVYTIDPNTKQPEWQKPIEYYKKYHDGDMVYIHNNTNSLLVTPDHNLLYHSTKNKQLRFRPASEFNTDTFMYGGTEWKGQTPEYIEIAGQKVKSELYCKLMAYWLADGSMHDKHSIKIAQQNNEWMLKELDGLPFNVWHDKNKLVIRNGNKLVDYFKKFGTCTTKHIPEEVKTLSSDLIKVFLNAYAHTDGYIHKNASLDGYKSNYNTQLFTTSEQMAADLGELALKAGFRPSYYKQKSKGRQIQFKNGLYTINNDMWIINLNRMTQTGCTMKKEVIHYSDFVYCVEVPKYHTLLVRRKGKVLWCGNCRHTYIVYLEGYSKPDFFIRDRRDAKTTAEIYASEQLQRSNERMIREWKRREAGSMSESQKLLASQKVSEWQAKQRALKSIVEQKGLPFYRQYEREQIGGKTLPTLPSFIR